LLFNKYFYDEFKEGEVEGREACSTHEGMRTPYNFLVQKLQAKNHLGDFGVVGRIILNSILNKFYVSIWPGFNCFRIGFSWDFRSTNGKESPDQLTTTSFSRSAVPPCCY
jgi:hypothetical protein